MTRKRTARTTRPVVRAVPAIVRRTIRVRLLAAPGVGQLRPEAQRQLVDDVVTLTAFADLTEGVDFPSFVAALLNGVFDAIVDGSIRQMEAYRDLVGAVAQSVDRFVDDPSRRDELVGRLPGIFERCPDGTLALRGQCGKARPAPPRRVGRRTR